MSNINPTTSPELTIVTVNSVPPSSELSITLPIELSTLRPKKLTKKQARKQIRLIKRYAKLLDAAPGLPIKIGLDGIIGLLPVAGDLVSFILSIALIILASKLQLPAKLYFKMIWNIVLDFLVGSVPLFGDIFDILFKANLKNYKLVDTYFEKNQHLFPNYDESRPNSKA